MNKSLIELRTTGFAKLKSGRIHLRCSKCGRKQSNSPRSEFDPPSAYVAEFWCDRCDAGVKDNSPDYFDKNGNRVDMCCLCFEKEAQLTKGYDTCEECRNE